MAGNTCNRRQFIGRVSAAGLTLVCAWPEPAPSEETRSILDRLKAGWLLPPRSYRPHTRWWWPGNAVTKDGITWQLEQMHAQGMGGVEIMSAWNWYAKGNIPYLSEQWAEMVRHAIETAASLDMEVALTFGPGWSFGGFWVPVENRSKVLAPAWQDITGPTVFDAALPEYKERGRPIAALESGELDWNAPDDNKVIAAVAGRLDGEHLLADSLTDLTSKVENGHLKWNIPAGRWRLMALRIKCTGQQNQAQNSLPRNWVVDHINKTAMRQYCDYLANAFFGFFGRYFGTTVDSFFCDSFEIHPLPNTLLWSTDTLEKFKVYKGYDLTPYMPAIWFDIGELTPKIRYDVNEFLHWLGLETAFRTFIEAAGSRNVQARIQPHYRFTEEIIQGAGMTPRPETEVTAARFEPIADPHKATVAGAHFYGRPIVSAESYTFIHPERYRTSLQDLKIATDSFLRDGVTQFYNHGYVYSPEMQVVPSRDVPWANRISHWNTWWPYYHHLTAYISRSAYVLRQGTFAGDVLVYSPQSTIWTQRVVFGTERRVMPYGNLAKTLVANGYDFDPVNDDVLQNHARVEGGHIRVREMSYRFLVLPKILALPLETLDFVRRFAMDGGVVIALDELPSASVGLDNHRQKDMRVRQIVEELFGANKRGRELNGKGRTYFVPEYKIIEPVFSPMEKPYQPTPSLTPAQSDFLDALRRHLPPDFALAGNRQSDGLTFLHRKNGDLDVYFVTNLQPKTSTVPVTFRVKGKRPDRWNPMTAEITPVHCYRVTDTGVEIPLDLSPWESTFIVFRPGTDAEHVTRTNLLEVTGLTGEAVTGTAAANGAVSVEVSQNGQVRTAKLDVSDLPRPLPIAGNWKLALEGVRFPRLEKEVRQLVSWTESSDTRHFSGSGTYELDFDLPKEYRREDLELVLDLGAVGNVAEVIVNGRSAGVCWMEPYRLAVTPLLENGTNHFRILVTNTLINHVAGMKKLPDVPAELVPHYGETADIYRNGAASTKKEIGYQPLPPSGLLGPVQIVPRRRVTIRQQRPRVHPDPQGRVGDR